MYEGVGDGHIQARTSEISRNYVGSRVCFSSPDTPWPLVGRSSGAVCLPIARTPCTVNTKRSAQQLERMPVVLARTRHWHTFVVSMTVWALSVLLPAAMEWTPMTTVHHLFVADKNHHYFIICHIAFRQAPVASTTKSSIVLPSPALGSFPQPFSQSTTVGWVLWCDYGKLLCIPPTANDSAEDSPSFFGVETALWPTAESVIRWGSRRSGEVRGEMFLISRQRCAGSHAQIEIFYSAEGSVVRDFPYPSPFEIDPHEEFDDSSTPLVLYAASLLVMMFLS